MFCYTFLSLRFDDLDNKLAVMSLVYQRWLQVIVSVCVSLQFRKSQITSVTLCWMSSNVAASKCVPSTSHCNFKSYKLQGLGFYDLQGSRNKIAIRYSPIYVPFHLQGSKIDRASEIGCFAFVNWKPLNAFEVAKYEHSNLSLHLTMS